MPTPSRIGLMALILIPLAMLAGRQSDQMPQGFQQVLPRGAIPAVLDPHYVPADEARVAPDAWVLGVVIDGQPLAYSLNLLNRHEVVNDRVGETDFAAVW